MRYKTKKNQIQSIYIEKSCFGKDNVFLPQTFKDDPLQFGCLYDSKHNKIPFSTLPMPMDGRIEWNMVLDKYYYVYNYSERGVDSQDTVLSPRRILASDGGIRTFYTSYSPNGHVVEFGGPLSRQSLLARRKRLCSRPNTRHVRRQIKKIDKTIKNNSYNLSNIHGYCIAQDRLRQKMAKTASKSKRAMYWKAFYRLSDRIKHMVDDLHWKTIDYMTTNYDCVVIGDMNIQRISTSSKYMKKMHRHLLLLKHGLFRRRLEQKCAERNVIFKLQNEACTSKTCSSCGWYHHTLYKNKVYECGQCKMVMDRDVNAARNIYMRAWFEGGSEFRFPMRANATASS
jgi:transposase